MGYVRGGVLRGCEGAEECDGWDGMGGFFRGGVVGGRCWVLVSGRAERGMRGAMGVSRRMGEEWVDGWVD